MRPSRAVSSRSGSTRRRHIELRFGGLDPNSLGTQLDEVERFYDLGLALRNIGASANRIAGLVGSLRTYARSEQELQTDIDLNEGLEDTLVLVGHRSHGVNIERDYGSLPPIEGYPGKLNQVWTNLIVNALQALDGRGDLTVRTDTPGPGFVRTQIIDTGPGIPAEHLARVFDLRFTTRQGRVEFGLGPRSPHLPGHRCPAPRNHRCRVASRAARASP